MHTVTHDIRIEQVSVSHFHPVQQQHLAPEQGRGSRQKLLPDARFIRKEIPMSDVLHLLNIRHDSRRAVCPQCGHRTLSIYGKNNTCRCFNCPGRSLSTIDVTMLVRDCKVGDAIKFLAANFPVPSVRVKMTANLRGTIKLGFRSYSKSKAPMTVQTLMLSPVWPKIPAPAKLTLAALLIRVPHAGSEQGCIHCGHDLLKQWTGLGRATITRALAWLRSHGWIHSETIPTRFRTKRGFPVRELFIRVNSHPRTHQVSATSNAGSNRAPQYAGSQRASSGQELENWTPKEGVPLQ